ncbi:helix-turn-helix transcriptional regulator [Flavihumibacter petaseus]|uniref:HTH araC/xylS-type domain-containing protein n=1 Tax=Flavihumibacter petaseus NBRC 106054 TaxID=1220578 RepID=A0A0E9N4E4_9BACT|nr:AraC family transcriptional regulator [Flavihumibacter petaseus]GAO44531.1 hypothetical protein FPE01S_03_05690 [Flavihumibacter petaseus NBRC 106054]
MDKINLANWDQLFGKAEQQIVFASDRYTDFRFQFEEAGLAKGSIHAVSTPGMQLTEFRLDAGQPFQLVDEAPRASAESVFILEGNAASRFHNIDGSVRLAKGFHNLQYNPEFTGHHAINAPVFHALTIIYDITFLQGLLQGDDTRVADRIANAIGGAKTFLADKQAMACRPGIADVISAIRQCRFTGTTRYLFLESKMLELLALQLDQAAQLPPTTNSQQWSVADRERLHAVKQFVENAYLEDFSLKELTYKFGLNEFKLKKGYKELFQTTVFGHLHQLRMQKARVLLQEDGMNVSEAAFFIGYNNVSSFCTEFKKRFGYTPGKSTMKEKTLKAVT